MSESSRAIREQSSCIGSTQHCCHHATSLTHTTLLSYCVDHWMAFTQTSTAQGHVTF